jgi:AcrR family transcriptional regulator
MANVDGDHRVRGGRAGLTLERIVATGVAVAGTDGLPAVSMSRVANELGVAAMSLYHHVRSKDQLVALMVDLAIGAPPPIPLRVPWREGLTIWARTQLNAYRRHLWVLPAELSAPPLGRNHLAWLETALRCLAETPLTEQQKLSTTLLVNGHVRTQAGLPTGQGQPAQSGPSYGQTVDRLIDPVAFPALRQAIASGALDDADGLAGEFEFGLGIILDGVEALIARPPGS